MSDTIKVEAATETRTPEQAARAAPVSLPAGSYEASDLQAALDKAAKAKDEDERQALVDKSLANLNQIGTDHSVAPTDYKRVEVVDEVSGVTETRTVFDGQAVAPVASKEAASPASVPAEKGE